MTNWRFDDVIFDYHKPMDFIGFWLLGFQRLFSGDYIVPFIPIFLILLLLLFISIVIMIIYYITLPIRFISDLFCALYTKILDLFDT